MRSKATVSSDRGVGMANIGFTREDFEIFGIPTFPERMKSIKEHVRPKLIALGEELQPGFKKLARQACIPTCSHAYPADCEPTPGDLGRLRPLSARL